MLWTGASGLPTDTCNICEIEVSVKMVVCTWVNLLGPRCFRYGGKLLCTYKHIWPFSETWKWFDHKHAIFVQFGITLTTTHVMWNSSRLDDKKHYICAVNRIVSIGKNQIGKHIGTQQQNCELCHRCLSQVLYPMETSFTVYLIRSFLHVTINILVFLICVRISSRCTLRFHSGILHLVSICGFGVSLLCSVVLF